MASAAYSKPLQRKLQEAGLQGCVDAAAFKRLLQYAEEVQGSLDKVHEILELLKSSEWCLTQHIPSCDEQRCHKQLQHVLEGCIAWGTATSRSR